MTHLIEGITVPIIVDRLADVDLSVHAQSAHRLVIISDSNVAPHYANALVAHCRAFHESPELLFIPAGESSKSREMKAHIEEQLFALGCGRDTLLIALGGGVILDLVGFVAATYCRGVPVIYLPTSLVAMVDAAIGGKTGINTEQGKNLLGTVTQPAAIYVLPSYLETLPEVEYRQGLAECLKQAMLDSQTHFDFIVDQQHSIRLRDTRLITQLLHYNIAFKARITRQDPDENGLRSILNLGHTIGHAVERCSEYRVSHGDAVAIGLRVEAYIALSLNILNEADFTAIISTLNAYKLNGQRPSLVTVDALIAALSHDKKSQKGIPRFVLLESIGKVYANKGQYAHEVSRVVIQQALEHSFMLEKTS